ncbi:MAG: alpha/beta fold hydrolase [Candidatus Micrarchaeota archaeon]
MPPGAAFPTVSGTGSVSSDFSWMPNYCQAGAYHVEFLCGESCGATLTTLLVDFEINNINRLPSLVVAPSGPLSVQAGTSVHMDLTATDPDTSLCSDPFNKDNLTLRGIDLPNGSLIINYGNETGEFSWATTPFDLGVHFPTLIVDDGKNGSDNQTVEINVMRPNPVLLVHGIYDSDAMWEAIKTDLEAKGFQVFLVGNVTGKAGLEPNNGDIRELSVQLQEAISEVKRRTGADKVDVIAHSMGGLVTSWYIKSGNFANDIGTFVTLSTPFYGTPISKYLPAPLLGAISGTDPADTARHQMNEIGFSEFLRELDPDSLSEVFNQKGVTHIAVIGTDNEFLKGAGVFLAGGFIDDIGKIISLQEPWATSDSDSVVPTNSQSVPGSLCFKVHATHSKRFGNPIAEHPDIISSNLSLLLTQGTSNLEICQDFEPRRPPGAIRMVVQAPFIAGQILVGETLNGGYKVGRFIFTRPGWFWRTITSHSGSTLSTRLIAPSGAIFNSTTNQTNPNVTYVKGPNFEVFGIKGAELGQWQANITAIDVPPQGENFTFIPFILTDVNLSILNNRTEFFLGDTVLRVVEISNGSGSFPGANVTEEIRLSTGGTEAFSLYDDGLHDDFGPTDGIYGGYFRNVSSEGNYAETITASIGTEAGPLNFTAGGSGFFAKGLCGDLNKDGVRNVLDVVGVVNIAFRGGSLPDPTWIADINGDGIKSDVLDVVGLINHAFRGGPVPTCTGGTVATSSNTATVSLGTATKNSDGTFTIPVNLNNPVNAQAAGVEIYYDAAKLQMLSPALTSRTLNLDKYYSTKNNALKVGILKSDGSAYINAGNGPVINVLVKPLTAAIDFSSLKVQNAKFVEANGAQMVAKITASTPKTAGTTLN